MPMKCFDSFNKASSYVHQTLAGFSGSPRPDFYELRLFRNKAGDGYCVEEVYRTAELPLEPPPGTDTTADVLTREPEKFPLDAAHTVNDPRRQEAGGDSVDQNAPVPRPRAGDTNTNPQWVPQPTPEALADPFPLTVLPTSEVYGKPQVTALRTETVPGHSDLATTLTLENHKKDMVLWENLARAGREKRTVVIRARRIVDADGNPFTGRVEVVAVIVPPIQTDLFQSP